MHTHLLTIGADTVRKRFVSWSDGEADREWAGLTAVARHAPGLAPFPIAQEIEDGAPVVVMSRVPGSPLGQEPLTQTQVLGLGTAVSRLFSVPVDPGIPERAFGPSTMRAHVRECAAAEYDLGRCLDPELVGRALARVRDWVAADHEHDRVEDAVLALGDGNLANVLWDGETCRLIDFEEFGVSDLAYELADVVEHASSRLSGLLDVDAFLESFRLNEAQATRLVAARQLLASFWLVKLLPGNGGFDRNPAGSTESQAEHALAMLE